MSETEIFLSYARADRATARVIAERLSDEGFRVWWDASLHSGETFDEVIERNLKDARAVVVLWSPAAVASRWVRAEATLADRANKLVPAIIEPCDRPIIFALTHTTELIRWNGDQSDARWRSFVDDLYRLVQTDNELQSLVEKLHEYPSAHAKSPDQAGASIANQATPQPLPPERHKVIQSGHVRPVAENDVHCLEIEEGELSQDVVIVTASGVKIGRTTPADIVLPHRSVSREHCIIGIANDELLVTDLNSTNGTFIDDVRICRATILPVGSVLRVGEISMRHLVRVHAETEQPDRLDVGYAGTIGQVSRFAAA